MKKKLFFMILATMLIGALSMPIAALAEEDSEQIIPADYEGEISYLLHPGDIIEINVFGAPGMHSPPFHIRLGEDGTVYFPLLGIVKLGGLTEVQATQKLDSMLLDGYLKDPQVTLVVIERSSWGAGASRRFSVTGAVEKPGMYDYTSQVTLLEAVNMAGGVSGSAQTSTARVLRKEGGVGDAFNEYIVDIYKDGADFEIRPRDKIILEEYGKYFITGEVMKPGEYYVGEKLTVSKAIILAGGFTEWADRGKVKIVRQLEDGETEIIKVPVSSVINKGQTFKDVELQDGDMIVVSESWI